MHNQKAFISGLYCHKAVHSWTIKVTHLDGLMQIQTATVLFPFWMLENSQLWIKYTYEDVKTTLKTSLSFPIAVSIVSFPSVVVLA